MEIWDDAGIICYAKSFPYEVDKDHFAETTEISAQMLEGSQGSGLLVTSDEEPRHRSGAVPIRSLEC
jgi:hypothetical protein